ncbi:MULTISPECIES: hypothetical protein [Sphingobacterium]|uniref:baeRF3 domain-containing protein n=1 Tax=Sphingobacterium TaxID=28453 RepID=UPI0013DC72C9|nr:MULTISPECIES: hypothetical protein [unclassified Sphingobacterium]
MKTLDTSLFQQLIDEEASSCLTIYIPVGREVADVNSNILKLKNLIKEIKSVNSENAEVSSLLATVEKKTEDTELFKGHEGCIGFFLSSSGLFEIVYLPACSDAFYQVDEVFYIVPLIDLIPKLTPYHVLALGKNSVRMYQGDYYGLEEIVLAPEIPRTMQEALGYDLTDNHLHAAAGGSATLHGYMEITDEKEIDNERFFRMVDTAVYEYYSKPYDLPLYLATISENLHLFKKISKNPKLQQEHIELSATTASNSELLQSVRRIIEDQQSHESAHIIQLFKRAKAENLATDQLRQVAKQVMDARVEHLLLGKSRKIYGDIFLDERAVKPDPQSNIDILNRLAILAHKTSAKTHIIHPGEFLLTEGAASVARY